MNSLENQSLGYKSHSPILNVFNKNFCKSKFGQNAHPYRARLKEANSFDVFPVVKTPPAKRFSKIVNPFEAALADRLHLPIIASPTLFQRPPTPQHSSTQFAWTIDDVSSLQPANVEPHETQFHDSPDPDIEAKAQSAISSFFKEQQIVPSPIDCPLRNKRIILSEITGNTPVSKPGRRIRDNVAQTILSLPAILPKELEDALAPYFVFNECQQSTSNLTDTSISAIEYDMRDASLRRKLFDHHGVPSGADEETFAEISTCHLTTASPPPLSPEVLQSGKSNKFDEAFFKSRVSDPMDKSSFGSLSPIAQKVLSLSPDFKRYKTRLNSDKNDQPTSPIQSPDGLYAAYRCPATDEMCSPLTKGSPLYRFLTPDRRSSVCQSSPYKLTANENTDSAFSIKISGLIVDTTKRSRASADLDMFADETQEIDEDEMQVSQLSAISNISSESGTPRSKRRSTSRKNLSQSFSIQNDSDEVENHTQYLDQNDSLDGNKLFVPTTRSSNKNPVDGGPLGRSILYRTDSGFNEMTTTSTAQYDIKTNLQLSEPRDEVILDNPEEANGDVSMICCSTPSKSATISA